MEETRSTREMIMQGSDIFNFPLDIFKDACPKISQND